MTAWQAVVNMVVVNISIGPSISRLGVTLSQKGDKEKEEKHKI